MASRDGSRRGWVSIVAAAALRDGISHHEIRLRTNDLIKDSIVIGIDSQLRTFKLLCRELKIGHLGVHNEARAGLIDVSHSLKFLRLIATRDWRLAVA